MVLSEDILDLYKIIKRYYTDDKLPDIITNHFYFKVCDKMSKQSFKKQVLQTLGRRG